MLRNATSQAVGSQIAGSRWDAEIDKSDTDIAEKVLKSTLFDRSVHKNSDVTKGLWIWPNKDDVMMFSLY